jgi:hypothetical protein
MGIATAAHRNHTALRLVTAFLLLVFSPTMRLAAATEPDTQLVAGPQQWELVGPSPVTFTWTGADDTTPADSLEYSYHSSASAAVAAGR